MVSVIRDSRIAGGRTLQSACQRAPSEEATNGWVTRVLPESEGCPIRSPSRGPADPMGQKVTLQKARIDRSLRLKYRPYKKDPGTTISRTEKP